MVITPGRAEPPGFILTFEKKKKAEKKESCPVAIFLGHSCDAPVLHSWANVCAKSASFLVLKFVYTSPLVIKKKVMCSKRKR